MQVYMTLYMQVCLLWCEIFFSLNDKLSVIKREDRKRFQKLYDEHFNHTIIQFIVNLCIGPV